MYIIYIYIVNMIICPEYNIYIYIPSISKPSLLKMCVYINICILTTNNREYIYIYIHV